MPLKVTLISHTPEPLKTIACAAKLCYSASSIEGIMDSIDEEGANNFVEMLSQIGHESPIEHISFTFGIEGISRVALAQLTRHRIASYSVQSQRYVEEGNFQFVIPPEIEELEDAKQDFLLSMWETQKHYENLTNLLFKKHYNEYINKGKDAKTSKILAQKQAIEDARFVLPNACETKLILTMNARSLQNFFRHRLCNRAQWEIRGLAEQMLQLLNNISPILFVNSCPPCVNGKCNEGKLSCGKALEVREKYRRGK